MAQRPGPGALSARLQCRLTAPEKAHICEQAHAAGMTLSTYTRHRLLGHRVIANADQASIRELRRLGGLLKKVHTDSGGAYSEDTARMLGRIKAAIERLAAPDAP